MQINQRQWKEPEGHALEFNRIEYLNCVKTVSINDLMDKPSVLNSQLKRLLPPFVMKEMQTFEEWATQRIQ